MLGSDIKIRLFTFGVARTVGSTLDPTQEVIFSSEGTRTVVGVGLDSNIGLFTCGVARAVGSTLDPRETMGYAIVKEQGHWLVLDLTSK